MGEALNTTVIAGIEIPSTSPIFLAIVGLCIAVALVCLEKPAAVEGVTADFVLADDREALLCLAGVLIGRIGYAPAFDAIAAIIVAVAMAFAAGVRIAAAPGRGLRAILMAAPRSTNENKFSGSRRSGDRRFTHPKQGRERMRLTIAKVALIAIITGWVGAAHAADGHWARVGEALGKPGKLLPGGIYKVALPRTDLKVTLDGVDIKPGLALGGWLAFESMGRQSMVMGDLVLTQDEVNPVMTKVLAGGLQVTALHNHLLRNRPFTMYLHVMGTGDPVKLAAALHAALAESKTPLATVGSARPTAAPASPPKIDLDIAAIDRALGARGANSGGILQYSIPRTQPVTDNGMPVPPAMGSAQGINFEPLGNGKAAITGDFVLTANEVAPVMKALHGNGIEVTALHNHMIDEQPRLLFMHFWAHDDAVKLARGLRAALSHIAIARG